MKLDAGTIINVGPDRYLIGFGRRTWESAPQSKEIPYFFFPDFFLETPSPWFKHEKWAYATNDDVKNFFNCKELPFKSLEWLNLYKELFYREFEHLQTLFSNGKLRKAVPFVFDQTLEKMNEDKLGHALHSALKYSKSNSVFLYGFWDENQGMLGATPEILFHLKQGNKIETMACAGTYRPSQGDNPDSLLNDPKEMREHQLVIDGIVESLMPLEAKLTLETTRVLRLPNIAHLVTPIQGRIKGTFIDLVHALHPTPALGAFPKKEGALWLKRYQTLINRRRFGAPIGFIHGDSSLCLVAIRNAQWDNTGISIGAGCGVVSESHVDREWQEIQAKLNATKKILGFL